MIGVTVPNSPGLDLPVESQANPRLSEYLTKEQREHCFYVLARSRLGRVWSDARSRVSKELRFQFLGN